MVTRVSTQLLPTSRSNVHLPAGPADATGWDAHPEGELETKLVRGCIPGRDRDSPQMKRIGSGGMEAAEARAATANPGRLHEISIRLGEVMRPAIGVGKRLDGCPELPLQLEPRTENLLSRLDLGDPAEIDVGACMSTDVEALSGERPNLLPRHPGMTSVRVAVPPRHVVRSVPLRSTDTDSRNLDIS